MNGRRPLLVPRANANDETVVLLRWHIAHGEWVERGASVAEVETTKALVDIEVEEAGYLLHAVGPGDVVAVGETLGWLADQFDPVADHLVRQQPRKGGATDRLVSRDAAELLKQYELTAADIPGAGAIRKRDVEEAWAARKSASPPPGDDWESAVDGLDVAAGSLLVYGADMQGTVVFDCIEAAGTGRVVAFVDDKPKAASLCGVPVLTPSALARIRKRGISKAHVAISDVRAKLACARRLKDAGFEIAGVRHPTAVVAAGAAIGEGVFLGPLVLV
ncbi:MAG: biotin/lipoyl-containing protein [Polyangiaceae bacterium]